MNNYEKTMLQIQDTLISLNLIETNFVCDLNSCKGNCCVYGDYGAPLEIEEIEIIDSILDKIDKYLTPEGKKAIKQQGLKIKDDANDYVTPLINDKECAFTYFDNGIAKCAIEKAYLNNEIYFQKPVSCHLYPVRVKKYKEYTAVNYHKWEICDVALATGEKTGVPMYVFLKDALIRRFGKDWYEELELAAETLLEEKRKSTTDSTD